MWGTSRLIIFSSVLLLLLAVTGCSFEQFMPVIKEAVKGSVKVAVDNALEKALASQDGGMGIGESLGAGGGAAVIVGYALSKIFGNGKSAGNGK